jgi:hypothetical protein
MALLICKFYSFIIVNSAFTLIINKKYKAFIIQPLEANLKKQSICNERKAFHSSKMIK